MPIHICLIYLLCGMKGRPNFTDMKMINTGDDMSEKEYIIKIHYNCISKCIALAIYSAKIAAQQTFKSPLVQILISRIHLSISINHVMGYHTCKWYLLLICAFLYLLEVYIKVNDVRSSSVLQNSITKIHNSYMDLLIQFVQLLASGAVHKQGLVFHYGLHPQSC